LREQRVRNVYGLGLNVTTNATIPLRVNYFLIAYGVGDRQQGRQIERRRPEGEGAVIKALTLSDDRL